MTRKVDVKLELTEFELQTLIKSVNLMASLGSPQETAALSRLAIKLDRYVVHEEPRWDCRPPPSWKRCCS